MLLRLISSETILVGHKATLVVALKTLRLVHTRILDVASLKPLRQLGDWATRCEWEGGRGTGSGREPESSGENGGDREGHSMLGPVFSAPVGLPHFPCAICPDDPLRIDWTFPTFSWEL